MDNLRKKLPNLSGNSILERFREYESHYCGHLTTQQIADFLHLENAKLQLQIDPKTMEPPVHAKRQCSAFFTEFFKTYGQNQSVLNSLDVEFQQMPLAFVYGQRALGFPYNHNIKLDAANQKKCDALVKYVFDQLDANQADLAVTVIASDSASILGYTMLRFNADMSDIDRKYSEGMLADWFTVILTNAGGAMILRIINPKHDNRDTLYGFRFTKGDIIPKSAADLQIAYETMPDGSRRPADMIDMIDYRTPDFTI